MARDYKRGTKGFTDELPVESLHEYEHELYAYIDKKAPEIFQTLRENPVLTDELSAQLDKTLKKFTKHFVASREK